MKCRTSENRHQEYLRLKEYYQDRYKNNKELQKVYDRKKYLWNKTSKEFRNIEV